MRIDELLSEGWNPSRAPELELIPDTGTAKVVQFKGRKLVITGGRRISTRHPDFTIGAWYFSMDGGAQLPCWVTGPSSAVCSISN
jgi:hypothetical protein